MKQRALVLLTTLLVLATWTESIAAQPQRPLQVAEAGIDHSFAAPVQGTGGAEDATVALTRLFGGVRIPVQLRPQTTLLLGVSAQATLASFEQLPPTIDADAVRDRLYALTLNLALRQRIAPRWWLIVAPQPGISSDLQAFSGDDLLFRGVARVDWAASDSLLLGAGVLYGTDFGEPLTLPLLRIEWDVSDSVYLSAVIPQRFTVMARIHAAAEAGLAAEISGNVFNLNDAPLGAQSARYSLVAVGPLLRLRLAPVLWLDISGGLNLARRFETDVALQDYEVLEFGQAPFIRATIAVRP